MAKDETSEKIAYGGQAVIEGVMMRSPRYFAVACRRENKEIVVQQESVESILKHFQWLNKPFLRGTLALLDAMVLGMKSLTFSANIAMEDAEAADAARAGKTPGKDKPKSKKGKSQSINDIAIGATVVLGLALGVGIFFVGPQLIVGLMEKWIHHPVWRNIAAGGVKLSLFVLYIVAISRMPDIRRVFQYHGAEHKVINTLEADQELTECNFSKHTTIHPRCGTSFILIVFLISIAVFCFLGWADAWYERVFYRLLLLPVVAGVAYEVVRLAGKHKNSTIMKFFLAPGLWMQRLTTGEPSDDQVEVALCALRAVMEKEREAESVKVETETVAAK